MSSAARPQPAAPDAAERSRRPAVRRRRIEGATCWVNMQVAGAAGLGDPETLRALLLDAVRGAFEPEERYKADGRSEVVRFVCGERRWVLKRYRTPGLRTRLLHGIRYSPSWREWRAALRLASHGVRGCPPLALIHQPEGIGCAQSLLLPFVEGERLDDVLRRGASPGAGDSLEACRRLALARGLGRQMGLISRAGLANRDHKPTNLLIVPDRDGAGGVDGAQPVLIDPAGVRRRRSARAVWRMLAQLRRTAMKAGPVSLREQLVCLRAVLRTDSSLSGAERGRLRRAAEAVERARRTGER